MVRWLLGFVVQIRHVRRENHNSTQRNSPSNEPRGLVGRSELNGGIVRHLAILGEGVPSIRDSDSGTVGQSEHPVSSTLFTPDFIRPWYLFSGSGHPPASIDVLRSHCQGWCCGVWIQPHAIHCYLAAWLLRQSHHGPRARISSPRIGAAAVHLPAAAQLYKCAEIYHSYTSRNKTLFRRIDSDTAIVGGTRVSLELLR